MQISQGSFAGVSEIKYCEECGRPLKNPISVKAGMGPICRGKHGLRPSSPEKKQDIQAEEFNMGIRLQYTGHTRCDCHCYIRVNGNVVLCTEAPDNQGTSITNYAENLATQVSHEYGIEPDKLVWIEHYIHLHPMIMADGKPEPRDTFDLVSFTIEGNRLAHPQWVRIDKDKAQKILGEPL